MTKADKTLVFVFLAALSTACGQSAATTEDKAASAVEAAGSAQVFVDNGRTAALDNAQAAGDTGQDAESLPSAAEPVATAVATVTALPLKRGFYVAAGTACGQASNATLSLLRSTGLGGSRDFCEFVKIEKTGESSYRVTEKCGDLQAGPDSEFTQVATWETQGDTGFRRTSDSGWESSARYCAQSSLPDPWRENDISDLVG
jgi:hypothetical protein